MATLMNLELFATHFDEVTVPKLSTKVTYPMFDILFTTLCASIAGAKGWHEIRIYVVRHLDWFDQHGIFLQAVPIEDHALR